MTFDFFGREGEPGHEPLVIAGIQEKLAIHLGSEEVGDGAIDAGEVGEFQRAKLDVAEAEQAVVEDDGGHEAQSIGEGGRRMKQVEVRWYDGFHDQTG